MSSSKEPVATEKDALNYCNKLSEKYRRNFRLYRKLHRYSQLTTLFLSGLTPILILIKDLPDAWKAVPSALIAISTGLLSIFDTKENWVSYRVALEYLELEK